MPTAHRPYRRIVVGIDGSGSSTATLDWAARQAALSQSELHVLITWEWPLVGLGGGVSALPADYDPSRDAAKLLRNVLAVVQRDYPDVVLHPSVCQGRAAQILVDASKKADLLVVGTHGHRELSAALFGSVSEDCAHHASCPVVIVRS
jgi:nucleotide-binding universal stress UspA family protein